MRVRTIVEAAKYFTAKDKDTPLNEWTLRRMCKRGDIPHLKSGTRYFVDIDVIEELLTKVS